MKLLEGTAKVDCESDGELRKFFAIPLLLFPLMLDPCEVGVGEEDAGFEDCASVRNLPEAEIGCEPDNGGEKGLLLADVAGLCSPCLLFVPEGSAEKLVVTGDQGVLSTDGRELCVMEERWGF